jgi:hypothetical protein
VLQLVAGRLSAKTVSAAAYEAECKKLVRADRARWFYGGNLLLPTPRQIVHKLGSWDEALGKAGLQVPRDRAPRSRPKPAPSLPDLMERFHDEYGIQPTAKALQEFARGNGIPYPDPRRVRFSDGLRDWLAQRRANGDPAPKVEHRRPGRVPGGARPAPRPDYSRDVARLGPASGASASTARASGAATTALRASRGTWTTPRARAPRSAGTAVGPRRRRTRLTAARWNSTEAGKRSGNSRRRSCCGGRLGASVLSR